jgi:hypothetical protein
MNSIERRTFYFKSPGKQNTDEILKLTREYVKTGEIENIVVASTTGETGAKAAEIFEDLNVVVVTHHMGFRKPGVQEFMDDFRTQILKRGAKILTSTHALSSAERAVRNRFRTIQPLEIMANVLRLWGEGSKACIEIVLMAADAGLIPAERDVIALAGTGRGADTALVIRPANSSRFFDLKIREIIAKPRDFPEPHQPVTK